jgi:DNA-binding IclR family transcriptional regulator
MATKHPIPNDDPAAENARKKSAVPSVSKALDVLELLAEARPGLTMNEIVAALNRTMGEIYRIVVYLSTRGYIEQDENTGRYALTLRLFELSHKYDPTERLISNGVPLLERIAARTEQSCHLGVKNRNSILILASVHSPRPAGYSVRTGAVFDLANTSTGNVITAYSPESEQKRYLNKLDKSERDSAVERLAHIRERGYEDRMSALVKGVRNLSVPIFDNRGIVAAITSGYIEQVDARFTPEDTLNEIISAAQELSKSLGSAPKD